MERLSPNFLGPHRKGFRRRSEDLREPLRIVEGVVAFWIGMLVLSSKICLLSAEIANLDKYYSVRMA